MNNKNEILLIKLAEKIKARRSELNISQEKLAEKCNFDRTYISLLERSKNYTPGVINPFVTTFETNEVDNFRCFDICTWE